MNKIYKIYKDFEGKKELLDQAIDYHNALDKMNRQVRISIMFKDIYKNYCPVFFIEDEKGVVVACSM